jgi:hypothetical protein
MGLLTPEQNEKINKQIICETRRQFEKAGFTVPKIAKELALIGFSDISDYLTVNEGGAIEIIPFKDLKKLKSKAIKKIREKTVITESKDGEVISKISTVEFELHDKLQSLGMAVDVIGIKKPVKHDVNLKGDLNLTERLKNARLKIGESNVRSGK